MPQTDSTAEKLSPLLLVVDDDPGQRSLLESFLSTLGFTIATADSGEKALVLLEEKEVDMMISDVRMPGMSGLDLLGQLRKSHPTLPVLLVTAFADVRDAVNAMRDGAANYLEKPIDLDELQACVHQAVGNEASSDSATIDQPALPEGIVGRSPQMQDVFRQIALVAPSETRVLITGESGAGKEVVADLLHGWSPRSKGPLIKVNCAAIPEQLLESELFGHEKGAFTGATAHRVGRFEEAHGGTILLDEIAEMSSALQAKLLRVTQDGSFQRVGSNHEHKCNTRVLASTNRDLEKEVAQGRFREDLFFRLNVMEIFVPALRERPADIVPLATRFAAQFSQGQPRFSGEVTTCLELYEWPGNVRELQNAMEQATLMARGEVILPEHLPRRVQKSGLQPDSPREEGAPGKRMEDVERSVILQTLREKGYNRTETARTLGISRRALLYKLQRFKGQGHTIDAD
jgi:DNA-binding NtrC family response regulator